MEDEGLLSVKDAVLSWSAGGGVQWRLPVSRIAVVGEWIDDDGLSISRLDHQLVFVDREAQWVSAPVVSAGFWFAMADLRKHLGGFDADITLLGTTAASRVIWPEAICGAELFEYVAAPASGWLGRLLSLFAERSDVKLSQPVLTALQTRQSLRFGASEPPA